MASPAHSTVTGSPRRIAVECIVPTSAPAQPDARRGPLAESKTTLDDISQRSPEVQLEESATSEIRVHHHTSLRRLLPYVAPVAMSITLAAACGAGTRSAADNRAIAIYSAAIRAAVTQPIGNPPTTTRSGDIFVIGAHASIALSIQAGIADTLENLATIRFVDNSSEAIDNTDPHKAVHGNGMFLTLGDIPPASNDVTITAQRYERADRTATLTIKLHRTGSTWKPVSTTVS
jgi:hypothetical protein